MDFCSKPVVYGVKHTDEKIRAASRSGGVFTAVSDYVLERDGVIYGCVMKDSSQAVHIRGENSSDRDKMRGSKYVQSNVGNVFLEVKKDADEGRYVLFSGTPCQIAGLKAFLGKDYENILYVDIVCHGVPSPKVWRDYVNWQEDKHHAHCVAVDFRNKQTYGWRKHIETLCMEKENGEKITVDSEVFSKLFCSHNILRPSCFKCPYKSVERLGDITLGDFWGIEKTDENFDDNKGVSLILVNSDKGKAVLDAVKEHLTVISSEIEAAMQPSLRSSSPAPESRNYFWRDYSSGDFEKIARKYAGYGTAATLKKKISGFKNKVSRKLRKMIKK